MDFIMKLLDSFTGFLWSGPMPALLLGTHIYFTIRLKGIQRWLPRGIRLSFSNTGAGTERHSAVPADESTTRKTQKHASHKTGNGVTPYAALATSLAATIGTGNIIGISTAVAIGGPGAVFWCWLTGVLGMATCYGESLLSVLYRTKSPSGGYRGGPMYVLRDGLHKKYPAVIFAIAAVLASFGMGSSVQSHSLSAAITEHFTVSPHLIGIATAMLAGFALLGGDRRISRICSYFVPVMSLFYLTGCLWLLFLNRGFLWEALTVIVRSAFSSRSLTGGLMGAAVLTGIRIGISRGLFTNEAGLGSIPMSAATAESGSPVELSLISMTGPFWDTVVICAITGLAIVSSILKNPAAFANISADALCFQAFAQLPVFGKEMLSLSLILFAFATILGWSFYGECSVRFLSGEKGVKAYQLLYLMSIYLGAVISLKMVWGISDLLNALMALPNLLCLWLLREKIFAETKNAGLLRKKENRSGKCSS